MFIRQVFFFFKFVLKTKKSEQFTNSLIFNYVDADLNVRLGGGPDQAIG